MSNKPKVDSDRDQKTDTPESDKLKEKKAEVEQKLVSEGNSQARPDNKLTKNTADRHLPEVVIDGIENEKSDKPRQLNDETVKQYAKELHKAVNETGLLGGAAPDDEKVFRLLRSLGEADRKAITEAYKDTPLNTDHRDIKTDMRERMSEENFRKSEGMVNARDGRTNDAGNLMVALTQSQTNRADGERRVIETFATLNSSQMEQLRQDFQKDYGITVDEAFKTYGISDDANKVLAFVQKPVEQRTARDVEELARFAVEKNNLDYLSISLRGDTPQAQEARRVLANDSEFNKKIVVTFQAKADNGPFGLGKLADWTFGPLDEIVEGGVTGDLTVGTVLGGIPIVDQFNTLMEAVDAKEDNLRLLMAQDLVREGRPSLSTIALNNTGSLFGWFDNKENIKLSVENASPAEREAFTRGRKLEGTTPTDEKDKNALAYYERLHKVFDEVGEDRETASWEAKLLYDKDSVQVKIAEQVDRNGRYRAVENMSREDWQRLRDPENGKGAAARQEFEQFLSKFVDGDERRRLLEIVDGKLNAESFEKSQEVHRSFAEVVSDSTKAGWFVDSRDDKSIVSGLEKLTAQEAEQYKNDPGFREQTDKLVRESLTVSERRYAEHMLRQVAETGKPPGTDPIGEVLATAASGADVKEQLTAIETLLQKDPELCTRLGSADINSLTPSERSLRGAIDAAIDGATYNSPGYKEAKLATTEGDSDIADKYYDKTRDSLSKSIWESGKIPLDLKAEVGLKNRAFFAEAAKASPEERERLAQSPDLTTAEKQLIDKVSQQGGELKLEDKMRLFVIGDGIKSTEYKEDLGNLTAEQKQKLKEDYVAKYGSALEDDFIEKVEKSEQQCFKNLLTVSETDGRQDYYDNLDEWLKSRSGGGLTPDGTALTVERAVTDQAALHQWFNSRFEKMPPEIREAANDYFKDALEQHKESKAKMAELLATIAITAAALAATPFTGGASLALVAGVAFVAGGVAKVAIHRAVEGGDYDWNKALGQFVGGGTEGALNFLGGKIVEGMFKGFNVTGNALHASLLSRGLLTEGSEAATGRAFTKLISQGKNVSESSLDDFVKAVAPGADDAAQESIRKAARKAVVQNYDAILNRATNVALSGVDNAIVGGGSSSAMVVVQSVVDGRPISAGEVLNAALTGAITGAVVGTLVRGAIEGRDIYVQTKRLANGEQVIVPATVGERPIVLEDADGSRRIVRDEIRPKPTERIVDGPEELAAGDYTLSFGRREVDGFIDLNGKTATISEQPLIIGRDTNQVGFALTDDFNVSRRHAQIRREGDRFILTDLNSSNGTYVNGQSVRGDVEIKPGDRLRFGNQELVFEIKPIESSAVLQHGDRRLVFEPGSNEIVLGRDSNQAQAVFSDVTVSRRHALLRRVGNDFYIRDLGSSNGTFVNGQPLQGEVKLSPGDRVRLGGSFDEIVFGVERQGAFNRKLGDVDLDQPLPKVEGPIAPKAARQSNRYAEDHQISDRLEDGWSNAGADSFFNVDGAFYTKGMRPALVVDRVNDPVLRATISEAHKRFGHLPPRERAEALTKWTQELLTPQGWTGKQLDDWYTKDFCAANSGERLYLGEMIRRGKGVCSQQAILLKVLADEFPDLNCRLVRGNGGGPNPDQLNHAWTDFSFENSQPLIYDPRHKVFGRSYNAPGGYHRPGREILSNK